MIIIGLTGSIGMGKSTVARMFADEGAAVFDADAAVHQLYQPGGAAAVRIAEIWPDVMTPDGAVDRQALGAIVRRDAAAFKRLEALVHPLVGAVRQEFLDTASTDGRRVAVLEIPLLFETGGDAFADLVAVVSAPLDIQRERVLARPGMTETMFDAILARQTPDAEKRARADIVIETGESLEATRNAVRRIMEDVAKGQELRRAQKAGD